MSDEAFTPEQNKDMAEIGLLPTVNASRVISDALKAAGYQPDFDELVARLRGQVKAVSEGNLDRPEAFLVTQAHTLDSLFTLLSSQSIANISAGYVETGERYMRLALKAQQQCSNTIKTLSELKYPRTLTVTGHANIATNQQVNISSGAKNSQTELFEENNEQLDIRATAETARANTACETMAAVNGT